MKNIIFGVLALATCSCFAQSTSCPSGFASIPYSIITSTTVNNYDPTICGGIDLTVGSGGTLNNYAAFSTSSNVYVPSLPSINITTGGTFNNYAPINYFSGIIVNYGNFISSEGINGDYIDITNNASMVLTNWGFQQNSQQQTVMSQYRQLVNSTTGMLTLNGNSTTSGGSSTTNNGYLTNNGNLSMGGVTINGYGGGQIDGTGTINNIGNITIHYGASMTANNIINNGTIETFSSNRVSANSISGTGTYTMLAAQDGRGTLEVETITQKSLNIHKGIVSISGAANSDITVGGSPYVWGHGEAIFSAGVVNGTLNLLDGVSAVGIVNGNVTLGGGTLKVANTLIDGNLYISEGALELALGGNSNDKLQISGATSVSGGSFNIDLGSSVYLGQTWEVISSTGGISGFDSMSVGTVTGAYIGVNNYQFTLSSSAGSGYITLVAVPEPETYAMMLAGLGLVGAMARRRNLAKV